MQSDKIKLYLPSVYIKGSYNLKSMVDAMLFFVIILYTCSM